MPPLSNDNYTVGWICALPKEMAAARYMFDEYHGELEEQEDEHDTNPYCFGRIGKHNIVVGCLPKGIYGTTSAAIVARNMLTTFRKIRFGLLVGIGGGVPSKSNDIRLGDVVVSTPGHGFGGVVPTDVGKKLAGQGFKITGSWNKPPPLLLGAVSNLERCHLGEGNKISVLVSEMVEKHPILKENGYGFDASRPDRLYAADFKHDEDDTACESCRHIELIERKPRKSTDPVVHYGLMASGNSLVKDRATRDRIGTEFNVLCFEMEAAGLMDYFPCLVVRGICDYADSHKNDLWQEYAAATAAAYVKELLCVLPGSKVANAPTAREAVKGAEATTSSYSDHISTAQGSIPYGPGAYAPMLQPPMYQEIIPQPPPCFPQRHTSDLAAVFVENRIQPIRIDVPLIFVERYRTFLPESVAQRDEWELKQRLEASWKDTTQRMHEFKKSLTEFRRKLVENGVDNIDESVENFTWDDVTQQARKVEKYYKGRVTTSPSIARALIKFAQRLRPLREWLDLVKNSTYTFCICGALSTIICAATNPCEMHEIVFDVVADISAAIVDANYYLNAYSTSQLTPALVERMVELCSHVLVLLKEALDYCTESAKERHDSSKIRENTDKFRRLTRDLNDEAKRINRLNCMNIDRDLQDQPGSYVNVFVSHYIMAASNPALDRKRHIIPEEESAREPNDKRRRLSGSAGREHDHGRVIAELDNDQPSNDANVPAQIGSLLGLLDFNGIMVSRDRTENRIPGNFDESNLQKLSNVTKAPLFRKWLDDDKTSSALLIQGHFDTHELRSPLAHLCAEIANAYIKTNKVIALTHFCSLHTESWDPLAQASGLIASLLGQLLSHPQLKFDLFFVDESFKRKIKKGNIKELCRFFYLLVAQLPSGFTLVCLIDSISFYETKKSRDDTNTVIYYLRCSIDELRKESSGKAVLKLLVTDANCSTYIWRHFKNDILDILG